MIVTTDYENTRSQIKKTFPFWEMHHGKILHIEVRKCLYFQFWSPEKKDYRGVSTT